MSQALTNSAVMADEIVEKTEIIELDQLERARTLENTRGIESKFAHLGRLQTARVFWKACMFTFFAAVGALFDGFAIVVPGSIVANKGFIAQFGTVVSKAGKVSLNAQVVGGWGGIQSAGQIISMWTGPFLSDRFGRKLIMYMVCLEVTVAAILEITAKNWKVYLVARLLSGMAVGLVQSGITVYISELAPPQIRGTMLAMYSVTYSIGGLCASSALQIVSTLPPSQFRHAFYSQFVFLGLFLPLIPFLAESPWYHARRHEHDKAKAAMKKIYGNVEGYDIEEEYKLLENNVAHFEAQHSVQAGAAFKELLTGINGRRTFISWFPLAFQQFSGLSLVSNYNTYFFGLAGITWPFLASLILKVITLAFTIISFFTVEFLGRRPSLMGGAVVMGLCMLVIGLLKSTGHTDKGEVIVTFFAIHVAAFNMSCGPLGWTFVAEISTPRLRAKTTGLAAGGTAVFGLLFNYTVPIMLANPGANWSLNIGYFWLGLIIVSLVIMYFFIPETKGRTYDELDELFERRISARKFKQTKTAADEARMAVVSNHV